MLRPFSRFAVMAGAVVLLCTGLADAATVTEYFNSYGSSGANLSGLGSTSGGWAGAWTGTATAPFPQYEPGAQLTYSSANYNNTANASGTTDGAATFGSGGNAGAGAYRQFDTGMTGTVWVSALVRFSNIAPDALLLLDDSGGTSNYIAIRNESTDAQARINLDGTVDTDEFGSAAADNQYSANVTYLMLARIQMNASGVNDQIDYWVFDEDAGTATIPSLPTTEAGLPTTPSFSKTGDFFGATFDGIGVSLYKAGTRFDAIRISNDADGYAMVRGVIPEPASLALLGIGAAAGVLVKRQSR